MGYTLLPEEFSRRPHIVVLYDGISDTFFVKCTKSGGEYFSAHGQKVSDYSVRYADLVGECFKYNSEVINGILSRIPDTQDDILVYFSDEANRAIFMIVNGNRELY